VLLAEYDDSGGEDNQPQRAPLHGPSGKTELNPELYAHAHQAHDVGAADDAPDEAVLNHEEPAAVLRGHPD
jgi:hypothetical protein